MFGDYIPPDIQCDLSKVNVGDKIKLNNLEVPCNVLPSVQSKNTIFLEVNENY